MSDQQFVNLDVDQIDASDRVALERLLGKPLDRGQHIFISAYSSASTLTAVDKAQAKQVIDGILVKAHENMLHQQISEAEVDAAINEAISNVRRRK